MACNEVEFYAQLLRKYLVKDAATLLLAEFSDWVAVTSPKSFIKLIGTVFHNGTAPVRALVDTEWKKKQIGYRMLIREHVIGLVDAEPSPLL